MIDEDTELVVELHDFVGEVLVAASKPPQSMGGRREDRVGRRSRASRGQPVDQCVLTQSRPTVSERFECVTSKDLSGRMTVTLALMALRRAVNST